MIVSFFVGSQLQPHLQSKAILHLQSIADRHQYHLVTFSAHKFFIALVASNKSDLDLDQENLSLSLGQLDQHPDSWDRFLRLKIDSTGLTIESDYAGSIPVFYSQRSGLALSNIEPCIFIASNSSLEDVSYENLYGYLRYNHFIWDETAWQHIYQTLPDARIHFSAEGKLIANDYLGSVKATDTRVNKTDKEVARDLFELNKTLVQRSLVDASEIILPLSSGYDSRLIFAVLANDPALAKKTRCFTYGTKGSTEVESARRLTALKNIEWHHVTLPCQFLTKPYLKDIGDIFGASLHMHGMYQIEFYEHIKAKFNISPAATLTSGFMTGVPAGQHNGLLKINDDNTSLTGAMNNFSQSHVWSDADLQKLPIFAGKNYLEKAEERFKLAFNRFDGELHQKAVMFDIWTRQRNFISYYPRVFEWLCPIASPHMNTDYANFYMSLSKEHLWDRRAVELMFMQHYPDIAGVVSNSNGIVSLGNPVESLVHLLSRILNRLHLPNFLSSYYKHVPIEFDLQAVENCGSNAFYPLFSDKPDIKNLIDCFGGSIVFENYFQQALNGNSQAYERVTALQAVAMNSTLTP